jgi:hypothetical protein
MPQAIKYHSSTTGLDERMIVLARATALGGIYGITGL